MHNTVGLCRLSIIGVIPLLFLQIFYSPAASAADNLKPGQEFRDCSLCPQMIVVPKGSFSMGSPDSEFGRSLNEGPVRRVTIDADFAVSKYEITVDQFRACYG